jgi:tRNA pseudouridine55 synthase
MSVYDGILLIDKREGETSYDVIRTLKRALGRGNTIKIGHAGTLDPFASGLLIVMLGQATKLSRFLMSGVKRYLATVRLGIETDTLDATGEITRIREVPELIHQDGAIVRAMQMFVGEIEQVPPLFSAVKVGGKRAYQAARRGESVRLASRKVTVHAFELKSVRLPDLEVEVACSGGTYIRSLAMDLGKTLGTGGHLKSLRRLGSGTFSVDQGVNSGVITRAWVEAALQERLISLRGALPNLMEVHMGEGMARKVRQGQPPLLEELPLESGRIGCPPGLFKLVHDSKLVAIARAEGHPTVNDRCQVTIERVFV